MPVVFLLGLTALALYLCYVLVAPFIKAILFALILMMQPGIGALGLVWVIGGYALILGVFEIMLGVELRSLRTV